MTVDCRDNATAARRVPGGRAVKSEAGEWRPRAASDGLGESPTGHERGRWVPRRPPLVERCVILKRERGAGPECRGGSRRRPRAESWGRRERPAGDGVAAHHGYWQPPLLERCALPTREHRMRTVSVHGGRSVAAARASEGGRRASTLSASAPWCRWPPPVERYTILQRERWAGAARRLGGRQSRAARPAARPDSHRQGAVRATADRCSPSAARC